MKMKIWIQDYPADHIFTLDYHYALHLLIPIIMTCTRFMAFKMDAMSLYHVEIYIFFNMSEGGI